MGERERDRQVDGCTDGRESQSEMGRWIDWERGG